MALAMERASALEWGEESERSSEQALVLALAAMLELMWEVELVSVSAGWSVAGTGLG
jgi:hypothetical protein